MVQKIAKEFIDHFVIHPDCLLANNADRVVCDYAIPLAASKVDNSHLIFAKIHFLRHPLGGVVAVVWTDSIWKVQNQTERIISKVIVDTILAEYGAEYGDDCAYVDEDNDFRTRFMVKGVKEGHAVNTIVPLLRQTITCASAAFDAFTLNCK